MTHTPNLVGNVIYALASIERFRSNFALFGTCCENSDGVRALGCEVLGGFWTVPEMTPGTQSDLRMFGASPPPQMLDDMPLDLQWKSLSIRIDRSNRGVGTTLNGDPIASTYELLRAKQHQCEWFLPNGLMTFKAALVQRPLQRGSGATWVSRLDKHMRRRLYKSVPDATVAGGVRLEETIGDLERSWPVRVGLTDQASQEIGAHCHLLCEGFRDVWFPGTLHQNNNMVLAMFRLAGCGEHLRILNWLCGPFKRGPCTAKMPEGRWRNVRIKSAAVLKPELNIVGSEVRKDFDGYVAGMEEDHGLAPWAPQNIGALINSTMQVASEKRPISGSVRWMSAIDMGKGLLRTRTQLLYLNDKGIQLNNCTTQLMDQLPPGVKFPDVFDTLGHSLLAGGYFLRQDEFFYTQRMYGSMLAAFREETSVFIKQTFDPTAGNSFQIALRFRINQTSGGYVENVLAVLARSNPGLSQLVHWGVYVRRAGGFELVDHMNRRRELLVRGFFSTHLRDRIVYRGGIYRTAALLSDVDGDAAIAMEYFSDVFRGQYWLEEVPFHVSISVVHFLISKHNQQSNMETWAT